jgi:hypothetical protein
MNHHSAVTASRFSRCAARVLLLVFMMGHTPVLPAMAGSVAWIDGGHTVQFTSTQNGVSLTLHHETGAGTADHAHSRWLSVVTVFTHDSRSGHSDHVIALPSGSATDIRSEVAAAPVPEMAVAETPEQLPAPFARHGAGSSQPLRGLVRSDAPPPVSDILQSVQLLI